MNTIYASFADASLAEKAAGALLDHGVRSEDLSLVRSHAGTDQSHVTTAHGTVRDPDYVETRDPAVGVDNPGGYSGGQALSDIADVNTVDATNRAADGFGTTYDRVDDMNDVNRRTTPPRDESMVYDREDRDDREDIEKKAEQGISTTTGADAGAGAVKGTVVGIGVGALAALASLFVPGVGIVLGGGALAAALGGVAASAGAGAAAGAVTGYLKDQGVDEHVAADYEKAIEKGGALLSVNVPSGDCDETRAREILDKYGASNVNAYSGRTYMA